MPLREALKTDVAVHCVLLFVAAYAINGSLHEGAHALTAFALGVPSTLYHFYADIALSQASEQQRALISVAGPLFSIIFGTAFLLAYRKNQGSPYQLLFLYLATFGVSIFLGNLVSISFVGDFSRAAALLHLPMPARYAITTLAASLLAVFMFFIGRELRGWASPSTRMTAVIKAVVLPVALGTLLVVLVYLPMPARFAAATISSSSFWIFAALGTFLAPPTNDAEVRRLTPIWTDLAITVGAVIVVRLLVPGFRFVP